MRNLKFVFLLIVSIFLFSFTNIREYPNEINNIHLDSFGGIVISDVVMTVTSYEPTSSIVNIKILKQEDNKVIFELLGCGERECVVDLHNLGKGNYIVIALQENGRNLTANFSS